MAASWRTKPRHRALTLVALVSLAACGDGYAPYVENATTTTIAEPQEAETTTGPGGTEVRFASVSAGATHTCAVDTGGGVWCWGGNRYGQLGDGALLDQSRPEPVAGVTGSGGTEVRFASVSAGATHTCAVDTGGGVWCWGGNFVGKLGTGDTDSTRTPTIVGGLDVAVQSVHAGTDRTCAVGTDTSLWCWGLNGSRQIWDRPTDSHLLPVQVAPSGMTAYSMIGGRGCAVTADGVSCYGNNIKDFAEQGIIVGYQHTIEGAPGGLAQIAQTRLQTCGRSDDGALFCWGGFVNPDGSDQHGRWQPPAAVPGLSVRLLAATESTMCMVTVDETVLCWGYRPPSSWMNPTEPPASEPWTMDELGDAGTLIDGVADVSGGSEHFCAVGRDGRIACWGANAHGQLGDGTTVARRNAVTVTADSASGD